MIISIARNGKAINLARLNEDLRTAFGEKLLSITLGADSVDITFTEDIKDGQQQALDIIRKHDATRLSSAQAAQRETDPTREVVFERRIVNLALLDEQLRDAIGGGFSGIRTEKNKLIVIVDKAVGTDADATIAGIIQSHDITQKTEEQARAEAERETILEFRGEAQAHLDKMEAVLEQIGKGKTSDEVMPDVVTAVREIIRILKIVVGG